MAASVVAFVFVLIASTFAVDIGYVGPECATCGFLANEIEGFLVEQRTETEIATLIKNDVCPLLSGKMQSYCNLVVFALPSILANAERGVPVANVCFDLKLCNVNLTVGPDMENLPVYTLDLDMPPQQRWTSICSQPAVQKQWSYFLGVLQQVLHPALAESFRAAGWAIRTLMPQDEAQEISGCALAAQSDADWMALMNAAYELTDACTSIVVQPSGSQQGPIHARNLDFGTGGLLTATMRNVAAILNTVQTVGGKKQTVAKQSSLIGFIGALSIQRSNAFSITVNTRFHQGGFLRSLARYVDQIVVALKEYPKPYLVPMAARSAAFVASNFEEAVSFLSNAPLISDCYYTISGVSSGQGAVISRNATGAVNVWRIGDNQTQHLGWPQWAVVQTNYDWWKGAPVIDDRLDPAIQTLTKMGQQGVTPQTLLFEVLSLRPVFNMLTAYSVIAENSNSTWLTYVRRCPYPCPL